MSTLESINKRSNEMAPVEKQSHELFQEYLRLKIEEMKRGNRE